MSSRATDGMIQGFLLWAVNYEEIISFTKIAPYKGRCWKIVVPEGIYANAMNLSWRFPEQYVPSEMILTAREALAFGYGLAIAGSSRDRRDWTQADWEARAERRSRS